MKNIPTNLEKHLTKRAKNALRKSFKLAAQYPDKTSKNKATPAHLLYALAKEEGSISKNILEANDVKATRILTGLKKISAKSSSTNTTPVSELSLDYKKTLKKAANYAMNQGHYFIGTEHLLYGTLNKSQGVEGFTQQKMKKVKEHLDDMMASYLSLETGLNPNMQKLSSLVSEHADHSLEDGELEDVIFSDVKTKTSKTPVLESFCENLSQKAADGNLDPLVGREAELNRLVRILSRKTKNNPLLVGDAGVGKTALVQGLAQKISEGYVPANLINKTVYSLNLSSLVAGTLYRGEFEERVRDLLEEAEKSSVILFIDEIHILPGAGSAQGSLDAANILKPALVNGAFQCIGATTYDEYKKTIEKDTALDRRFQKIFIKEQTPQEAIKTLVHLKPFYEQHHNVAISDKIINMCVDLSVKYIPSRFLPDKALDILDEASSLTRTEKMIKKEHRDIKILQAEIIDVIMDKEEALRKEHYQKAMQLKNKQEALEQKIYKMHKDNHDRNASPKVTEKAVYEVISEIAGVPLRQLTKQDSDALSSIEAQIGKHLFGQDDAIKKVAKAIRRNRTGVTRGNRPIASMLFMGPSGVGKTELAKIIAHSFSGTNPSSEGAPGALIKLDMSEYSEAHTISRLIGAPPGYVGYEDAGLLTDKVRKHPYSVVLFDEIEKAHPKIFNVLLQILEEGTLTDSQGKSASFKNTFIILTSNVGATLFGKNSGLGFSGADSTNREKSAMGALKELMKPEIINRLDGIVVFNNLDSATLEKIAEVQIHELKERLSDTIEITFSSAVAKWLAHNTDAQEKGARGIRKAVETHLEEPISDILLKEKVKNIKIEVRQNKLVVKTNN
ncbi:MAG: ATP-dependent Clp protease ATP-binding subunit [Candidatus Spechtbacterales bacterium]